MNISVFLAQAFSLYLLIMGIAILWRKDFYIQVVDELVNNKSSFLVAAIFTLILGILLVVSHNKWVLGWPVVITILSWLTFLKGLFYVLKPDFIEHMKAFRQAKFHRWSAIGCLLVATFLGYHGFLAPYLI